MTRSRHLRQDGEGGSLASPVWQMDGALNSSRIAVGCFESRVEIWDTDTTELISQFESVLYPGGRRLALSSDGKFCFVAGWKSGTSGGVVAHDASTGAVLWHRSDISEVQSLIIGRDGQTLWCSLDTGSTLRLDVLTGVSANSLGGGDFVAEDRRCERWLTTRRGRLYVNADRAATVLNIGPEMILSATFTTQGVCISEAAKATMFFNRRGQEIWRFIPKRGSHLTQLYCTESDQLYGICVAYSDASELGNETALLRLDTCTGEAIQLASVLSPHGGAWSQDETFVTSRGEVIQLDDGRVTRTIPFDRDA